MQVPPRLTDESAIESEISLLFISAIDTPVVREDLTFLKRYYHVRDRVGHGFFHALKIMVDVFRSDLIFCWFASVYASVAVVLARTIGVPTIIIVGGVDVAKDKELKYGMWLSPWRSRLLRYALVHADQILVVDPSLKADAIRLAKYDGHNIAYLPTGYDSAYWTAIGAKERFVLTVAAVRDERRFKVKGIDVLIQVAWMLRDIRFVVVGVEAQVALSFYPPMNMSFLPAVPREDLLQLYREAKVYCQPSVREGLPSTLCESMLCECIPVATDVGGSRTAVGNSGILVVARDVEELSNSIRTALDMPASVGMDARSRIVSMFPKQKRETGLLHIITDLIG